MKKLADMNTRGGAAIFERIAERFGVHIVREPDGIPMHRPAERDALLLRVAPKAPQEHYGTPVELDPREFDLRRVNLDDKVAYLEEQLRRASRRMRGGMLHSWLVDQEVGLPEFEHSDKERPERAPALVDALSDLIRMVAQDDPTLLERAGFGLLTTYERTTKERP